MIVTFTTPCRDAVGGRKELLAVKMPCDFADVSPSRPRKGRLTKRLVCVEPCFKLSAREWSESYSHMEVALVQV